MSTSDMRLAITGYTRLTSGALGQGRGQSCRAPCTAGPPARPASPTAPATVGCENSTYGSCLWVFPVLLGGAPRQPPGGSAASSGEPASPCLGANCQFLPCHHLFYSVCGIRAASRM